MRGSSCDVGAGVWIRTHAGDDGHVKSPVEAPVAAAVEPVADGVAGGGGDGVGAGQARERCLGADSAKV